MSGSPNRIWFPRWLEPLCYSINCLERIPRTDAMMMRRPEPLLPPMMATVRLGTMATLRVIRFLFHFFILMSKNPYYKWLTQAYKKGLTRVKTFSICFKIAWFTTWNADGLYPSGMCMHWARPWGEFCFCKDMVLLLEFDNTVIEGLTCMMNWAA